MSVSDLARRPWSPCRSRKAISGLKCFKLLKGLVVLIGLLPPSLAELVQRSYVALCVAAPFLIKLSYLCYVLTYYN